MFLDVPDNTRTITTCRYSLRVVFAYLDRPYSASVFFKWNLHYLSLLCNLPNSNLSLSSSWNDSFSICSYSNSCAAMVMSIIDNIEEFAGLRQKGSYFSVRPSRNNALSVMGESDWKTLKTRNLYSKQFLSILCIPNSDFVWSCSSKHFRVVMGKSYVIDSLVMTSVSKLRNKSSWINPINVRLRSSSKEVGVVSSERNWSNIAHKFTLWEDVHVLDWNSSKFTLACADD